MEINLTPPDEIQPEANKILDKWLDNLSRSEQIEVMLLMAFSAPKFPVALLVRSYKLPVLALTLLILDFKVNKEKANESNNQSQTQTEPEG